MIWPNNRDPSPSSCPISTRLAVVALVFPTFRDGRAYSQARLLRERYNYRGRIAGHRPGAARSVRVHAARRLRFVRGRRRMPMRKPSRATVKRYTVFYQPTGDGRITALHQAHAAASPREVSARERNIAPSASLQCPCLRCPRRRSSIVRCAMLRPRRLSPRR